MRFIHVGVGGFGMTWVSVLKESPRAEVVALVDVNEASLDQACKDGGYDRSICYGSLAEAIKAVKADAVVVSTPPRFHKKDVIAAMKAGLDVISEKPMADTLADCKAMLKASRETGQLYVVSQNYRYSPEMDSFAKAIKKASLGNIGQVKMDFFMGMDFGGGFRHEMDYPLVVDMSIHHFDLIRYLTGLNCVAVRGMSWNPHWSNYQGDCSSSLIFEADNGAHILYNGSWCSKIGYANTGWNGNWLIEADKGSAQYQQGEIKIQKTRGLYEVKSEKTVEVKTPRLVAQHQILADFIKAVASDRQAPTDVYDNIHSVAMVFAAVKAMKTGKRVPVLDTSFESLLSPT